MKDVKSVLEIPHLEEYLDYVFKFSCYCKGDNTLIYEAENSFYAFTIEIISDENEFFDEEHLADLINYDNIVYFQLNVYIKQSSLKDEEREPRLIESYAYRPLIAESDKDYYSPDN